MKKILALVLSAMMMLTVFAGCGSEEKQISFDEIYSELTSSIDFSASNMQKQEEAALNNYYYIDPETLESYSIYMSDYATGNADEIAMFKLKDESKMSDTKSLIDDRINDLKNRYEGYKPEEMDKINNAVVVEKGNYIFVVISPNAEQAKEVLNKAIA